MAVAGFFLELCSCLIRCHLANLFDVRTRVIHFLKSPDISFCNCTMVNTHGCRYLCNLTHASYYRESFVTIVLEPHFVRFCCNTIFFLVIEYVCHILEGSFLKWLEKERENEITPAHLRWWVSFCLLANILFRHNMPSFL